ncbi:uncharacterized protein LOC125141051 [Tachysurus ichikawai]
MAEGRLSEDLVTPRIGRGRGLFGESEPVVGKPRILFYEPVTDPTLLNNEPVEPNSSTPANAGPDNVTQQLRDLIGELGSLIGDSIVTRLSTNQTLPGSIPSFERQPSNTLPLSTSLDLSKLNLIVKADIKEPQMFRGDGGDKCSILEWIEQINMYLSKRGCGKVDGVEEILNHLCSRAKSIVKVKLKNSPVAALSPEVVYGVLQRYFSESPGSCQPLADFYVTQPKLNEHPVDYWVASWVEGTAASDDLHGLSYSADSAVSLDVVPESLKPEQSGSQGDQAKESNNAVSPDESCDSGSLLSETVHENRYILPSGVVEQPPGQRGTGVQTRTGRMVKPVNRLIENMTQSIKTLNQVGVVVRSLLK